MWSSIPFVGWILDFVIKAGLAVPFWFFWTFLGIGKKFFYFVPVTYQSIGFVECIGLFFCIGILGVMVRQVVPTIISIDNSNSN